MSTRIVIVDDQAMVRAGFAALLEAQDDFEVVGQAENGEQGVRLAVELSPDVVLMDIRMPVLDGIEATRRILASGSDPAPAIIVLTTFDADEYVFEAIRAGASGFLLKDATPAELVDAVRIVLRGDALLSPSVTRTMIERFARLEKPRAAKELPPLTGREREVLLLVARGLSNAEIADALTLAEQTVKSHVSHVLMKLGARDRAQAVVAAYESRLVVPAGE
ncbi:response regulator transcription factor [Glaciihabitans arcticus]|uniref:Response regulator transcription factor n=1 Tax=Glaciihabitans arcticus TaxID=2668039 RepID=A0A4Q9H0Y6_9MICO|nr:response regulator transcription factor [Glaciihabitans arcticus]TBN58380.1 response regulator transcription factor [Glaciihabitans arcticus]